MGESKRRKLSRDATPEEIFPERHQAVPEGEREKMAAIIETVQEFIGPRFGVTLFINERMSDAEIVREGRAPRFNYMSTEDRPDMVAVLRAFVARNSEATAIDRAIDAPPAGRA
jgi:hypothetical protein